MKVGVKFCGHCAPRMDMAELCKTLRARAPELVFGYYAKDPAVDVLLILNACPAECASRPDFQGPVILVSPDTVDHWPTPPEQLCSSILRRIQTVARSG